MNKKTGALSSDSGFFVPLFTELDSSAKWVSKYL